ncbi:MAG: class I SAM-dependent methyltransferase [Burkholderiales bacterium]|nr:class I SAM-dependent methyltransferase [Burkholderiales bacterium]
MFREKAITRFLGALGAKNDLPLQVALWNGETLALGPAPKVTIRLPDRRAARYLVPPSLANLARGYVTGRFDVDGRLDDVIAAASGLARAGVSSAGRIRRRLSAAIHTRERDRRAISHHYDVSNDFYRRWLDPEMVYSCAYFRAADEALETAQMAKLDHIFAKIMLKPNERLLDIGCGWGALALRAASRHGARVLGVTLSQNQFELARERVRAAGLADRVEIRLQDYRDVEGTFDKITSVGMFEHVGLKNLRGYFAKIRSLLADGGLALNHGITSTDPDSAESPYGAGEFIHEYVFPHGELPHIGLVLREMQAAGLEALDVESLRRHYARTLSLWAANYEANAGTLRRMVDETTFRVWRVYLAGCAYAFQQDWVSIYQVLVCKSGAEGLNPTPLTRHYMYR